MKYVYLERNSKKNLFYEHLAKSDTVDSLTAQIVYFA